MPIPSTSFLLQNSAQSIKKIAKLKVVLHNNISQLKQLVQFFKLTYLQSSTVFWLKVATKKNGSCEKMFRQQTEGKVTKYFVVTFVFLFIIDSVHFRKKI